jgi:hypothetical protein
MAPKPIGPDVSFGSILLQKSAAADGRSVVSLGAAGYDPAGPDALYATATLRDAQSLSGWWSSDQRCEPPQVLGNGSQNKLILGASWTAQSKPAELQVRKPHLDLLALTA